MNDTAIHSLGLGLATRNAKNEIIEVYYPAATTEPGYSPEPACYWLIVQFNQGGNAVSEVDETSARALVD